MNRSARTRINVHGTCLSLSCAGQTAGVLLQGASGSGKSSLALRLMDQAGFGAGSTAPVIATLVSDDQVLLEELDGVVTATAPSSIRGLLEVRGIGIIKVENTQAAVCVDMVIAHAASSDIDRIPEPQIIGLAGRTLPLHKIDFSDQSSAAVVRSLALVHWGLTGLSNR